MSVAPLVLPFAVALLFGNLDAWYPLLYGALLLAVLPGASKRVGLAGGAAAAIVVIAKLDPAPLLSGSSSSSSASVAAQRDES